MRMGGVLWASWNFTVAMPEREEEVEKVDIVKLSSSEESEMEVLFAIGIGGVGER